ncbi:hypothetical protein CBZ_07240 [Cellulomonas biazotea]|uniref:Uncharacterized protein n=1 Tax=Cellulomonas biazotea TaxID=1709 RepID=A0A402DNI2_9CELL|nr:hypothetical protein CBZ_07240 [Cellulomonas biazotea]
MRCRTGIGEPSVDDVDLLLVYPKGLVSEALAARAALANLVHVRLRVRADVVLLNADEEAESSFASRESARVLEPCGQDPCPSRGPESAPDPCISAVCVSEPRYAHEDAVVTTTSPVLGRSTDGPDGPDLCLGRLL